MGGGDNPAPFTHLLDKYTIFLQIGEQFLSCHNNSFSLIQKEALFTTVNKDVAFNLEVIASTESDVTLKIKNSKNQYLEWNFDTNELEVSEGVQPNNITSTFIFHFNNRTDEVSFSSQLHNQIRPVQLNGKKVDSLKLFYKVVLINSPEHLFIQISNYKSSILSKFGYWKIKERASNSNPDAYQNIKDNVIFTTTPNLYSLFYQNETLIEINHVLITFEPIFKNPISNNPGIITPPQVQRNNSNHSSSHLNNSGHHSYRQNSNEGNLTKFDTTFHFEAPIFCEGSVKVDKLIELINKLSPTPSYIPDHSKKIIIFCSNEFYCASLFYYLQDKGISTVFLLKNSFSPATLPQNSSSVYVTSDNELLQYSYAELEHRFSQSIAIHFDTPESQTALQKRYSLFVGAVRIYSIVNMMGEEERVKLILSPGYLASNRLKLLPPRKILGIQLEFLWNMYDNKFPPFLLEIIQLLRGYKSLNAFSFREVPDPSIIIDLNARICTDEKILIRTANYQTIPIVSNFFITFLKFLPEKLLDFPPGVNISNFALNISKVKYQFFKEIFDMFRSFIASNRLTEQDTKMIFEEYLTSNTQISSSTIYDQFIKYYDILFSNSLPGALPPAPISTPSAPILSVTSSNINYDPKQSLYPAIPDNYVIPKSNAPPHSYYPTQPPPTPYSGQAAAFAPLYPPPTPNSPNMRAVNHTPPPPLYPTISNNQQQPQPLKNYANPPLYPTPNQQMVQHQQMNHNHMNRLQHTPSPQQNYFQVPPQKPPMPNVPAYKPSTPNANYGAPSTPSTSSQTMKIDFTEIAEKQIKIVNPPIGVGSFGAVYRGEYDGIPVAIKKFTGQLNSSQSEFNSFLEEITILCSCRHPNILRFYGVVLNPLMLVTEFAEFGNLQQYYTKNPSADWQTYLKFSKEIVRGLRYLHSRDPVIVHRDIKSLNILITSELRAVIADFGLTAVKSQGFLNSFCGSPAWTAPEILRSQPYDEKADIYSLGIVFWEIFTRKPPYLNMQANAIIGGVMNQNLRPALPSNINTVPHNLLPYVHLIVDCWNDNPSKRPNCSEILERLEKM